MNFIVRARGEARDIQQIAAGETLPEGFVVYDGDPLSVDSEGDLEFININVPPYIRPMTTSEKNARQTIPGSAEYRQKRKLKRASSAQQLEYLLERS